jgi:hypothetical protein
MRRKSIPAPEQIDSWYVAELLPGANSIFPDSFYPEVKNGKRTVYVSISKQRHYNPNPSSVRIRIMNGANPKSLKVTTGKLAMTMISVQRPVTNEEFSEIDKAIKSTY